MARKESNWRRKGFLEKVFLPHERYRIRHAREQDQVVWLLWSLKEAAYKAHQRSYAPGRSLDWHRLSCTLSEENPKKILGEITVDGNTYYSVSAVSAEGIHTTVQKDPKEPVHASVWAAPSGIVKKFLLERLSRFFSVPMEKLFLKKNKEGIPFVYCDDREFFSCFSLSDHGRYSGFSLSLRIS